MSYPYSITSYELVCTTWCCNTCGSFARVSQLYINDLSSGQKRHWKMPKAAPFYSQVPVIKTEGVIWTPRCEECVSHPAPELPGYLSPAKPDEPETLEDLDL